MNSKEQQLKETCMLAGVKYRPPLLRLWFKVITKMNNWMYFTFHKIVAYLLWGLVQLKLISFDTFARWCFCRKPRRKYGK